MTEQKYDEMATEECRDENCEESFHTEEGVQLHERRNHDLPAR